MLEMLDKMSTDHKCWTKEAKNGQLIYVIAEGH